MEWIEILEQLETTNKYKDKHKLIKSGILKYKDFEQYLRMTFDTYSILNIEAKTIENILGIKTKDNYKDIGEKTYNFLKNTSIRKSLLDIENKENGFKEFLELYNNILSKKINNMKYDFVVFFNNTNPTNAKWFVRCLVKDLRIKTSITTINNIFEELGLEPIKKFAVQLAIPLGNVDIVNKIDKVIEENGGIVYAEPKYDGCRIYCTNINPKKEWKVMSRNGKPILNTDNIVYECNRIFGTIPTEFDGEWIAEDFYSISKTIHSKNDTATIIPRKLMAFDITYYKKDISHLNYTNRIEILKELLSKENSIIIEILENRCFTNSKDIINYYELMLEKGMEGIIIKLNKPYTRKREYWYKLKPVETLDLEITGFEIAKDGEYVGKRSVLIVEDYSRKLKSKVGSGLKKVDIDLFSIGNEENWIGKIVEIGFDSITPINEGKHSLRFPRYIKLRNDKEVADTI